MKLTKKKKKKIKEVFEYIGLTLIILVLIGAFVLIGFLIPEEIENHKIEKVIRNSISLGDKYEVCRIKEYGNNKAVAYITNNPQIWKKSTYEYVVYLEKVNNVWTVKNKVMIWSK